MGDSKRINEIDIAKGIGIILVIIGHNTAENGYIRSVIYQFHMPLFFFLSGLVMKTWDFKEQKIRCLLRKEHNLIINYVIWSIIYIGFDIFIRYIILGQMSNMDILLDVYVTCIFYGINVLWFIPSLVIGKMVVQKMIIYAEKKSTILFLAVLMYISAGVISVYLPDENLLNYCQLLFYYVIITALRGAMVIPFIILGYLSKEKAELFFAKKKGIFGSFLGGILYLIAVMVMPYSKVDFHFAKAGIFPVTFIFAIWGIYMVLSFSSLINKKNILKRLLCFYGRNSLLIMVTHEYLKLKGVIHHIVERFIPDSYIVLEIISVIVILVIVETFLCLTISGKYNKIVGQIERYMKRREC